MRERAPEWLIQSVAGITLGIALGILVGWWLWPVTYTNTSPAALRTDYRDEYILMTAAAFEVDQNLDNAHARLEHLNPEEPGAPAAALAEKLIKHDGSEEDIARLARLADAFGVSRPSFTAYLEGDS
jgi:putative heme iron utilization protein